MKKEELLNEIEEAKDNPLKWIQIIHTADTIPDDVICQYADEIPWEQLCRHQVISNEILIKFPHKIKSWHLVFRNKIPSFEVLDLVSKYFNWTELWRCVGDVNKATELIDRYPQHVDWTIISTRLELTSEFVEKYQDKLNWSSISYCDHLLNEDFIRKYKDRLHWDIVSSMATLSEDVIREFSDYVHWDSISSAQDLSEKFIIEMQDYLFWDEYYLYGHIETVETIRALESKIDWIIFSSVFEFTEEIAEEFEDKICWDQLYFTQPVSESFVRKYMGVIPWDKIIDLKAAGLYNDAWSDELKTEMKIKGYVV